MADPTVPVEGNDWILNSIWSFLEDTAKTVTDKATEVAQSAPVKTAIGFGSNVIKDVKAIGSDVSDVISGDKSAMDVFQSTFFNEGGYSFDTKTKVTNDHREKRRQLGDELKTLGGWEQAKDIVGGLWGMGKQKVFGTDVTDKLVPGVDPKAFNDNLDTMRADIDQNMKAINDITSSDPKFKEFRDFNDNIKNQYLKDRNLTTVQDEADFEAFKQSEYSKLDPMTQQKLAIQEQGLYSKTEALRKETEQKQEQMRAYLNTNIRADGTKTGEQVYNDIQKESENLVKGNKLFELTAKIRGIASDDVDEELAKDSNTIAGISPAFKEMKDAVIDLHAADIQYEASIAGMNDIPDNEAYADKFKEGADMLQKVRMDMLRTYAQMDKAGEFKGMSEVDRNDKALAVAYKRLTPEEQQTIAQHQTIKSQINQNIQAFQTGQDIESHNNMKAVLDGLAYQGAVIDSWFNRIFENVPGEVPYFVKKEMRPITYSNEGMLAKGGSMLAYNADTLLSLGASMKLANLPIKGVDEGVNFLAKVADKGMSGIKVPLKWGFTDGYLSIVPKAVKTINESVLSGAATDTIVDNVMAQAPDKTNDDFNLITGMLFDVGIMPGAELGFEKLGKSLSKNNNSIMWKYMKGEEKDQAIKEMQQSLSKKFGKEITEDQAKGLMESAATIATKGFNAADVDNMFGKPGELYKFIKPNLEGLKANDLDEVLAPNGLHLKKESFFGMSKDDLSMLSANMDRVNELAKSADDNDIKMKMIQQNHMDNLLNTMEQYATGKGSVQYNQVTLMPEGQMKSKGILDDFYEDRKDLLNKIQVVKSNKVVPLDQEEKEAAIYELDKAMYNFQSKYGNSRVEARIELTPVNNPNKTISIAFKDLESLDGLQNKSLQDMIREGNVTAKDGTILIDEKAMPGRGGAYKIKLQTKADEYVSGFFKKEINPAVTQYVMDRGLDPAIAGQIATTMRNFFNGGKVTFDYIAKIEDMEVAKKETKALGEMIQKQFEKFIGSDNVGKQLYINDIPGLPLIKSKDIDEKQMLYQGGAIIDHVSNLEKPFTIAYGNAHSSKTDIDKKLSAIFYITMGKDISWKTEFSEMLSGRDLKLSDKTKEDAFRGMGIYASYSQEIMGYIVKYGLDSKTGRIDVQEGIKKAQVVVSTNAVPGLFHEGKLVESKVHSLVDEIIPGADQAVKDFVYKTFIGSDESNAIMIPPMVKNLAYKYQENKPLIDELFKRFKADAPTSEDFIKAFSNIILNPEIYDDIAAKLLTKDRSELMSKAVRDNMELEWKNYSIRLDALREKLQMQLDDAKAVMKQSTSFAVKDRIKMDIDSLKAKIAKIEGYVNSVRAKGSYMEDGERTLMNNVNLANIQAQANNFAFTAMVAGKDIEGTWTKVSTLYEAKIMGLQKQLEEAKQLRADISIMTDDEKTEVKSFLEQVQNTKTIQEQQELLAKDFSGSSKLVQDSISKIKSSVNDSRMDLDIVDKDMIREFISNFDRGIYDYNFVIKNNPVERHISAFVNNSNTGQIDSINQGIMRLFQKDGKNLNAKANNVNDLYIKDSYKMELDGKKYSFKDVIDSLYAKGGEDFTGVDTSVLEAMLKKVFTSDENSAFTILTKRSDRAAEENSTMELLDRAMGESGFIEKFKAIGRRKTEYVLPNGESKALDINLSSVEVKFQPKGSYDWVTHSVIQKTNEPVLNDTILQLDNMVANGMDVNFIRNVNAKELGNLQVAAFVKNAEWETKLNPLVKLKNIVSESEYATSRDHLELLERIISRDKKTLDDFGIPLNYTIKDRTWSLKTRLQQLGFKPGYYFMGNFGDKDSVFTMYRPFASISDSIEGDKRQAMAATMYGYEYAFSNGYFDLTAVKDEVKKSLFKDTDAKKYLRDKFRSAVGDTVTSLEDLDGKIKLFNESVRKDFGMDEKEFKKVKTMISEQAIKKREASNMSTHEIFEGVKLPLQTYIGEMDIESILPFKDYLDQKALAKWDVEVNLLDEFQFDKLLNDPELSKKYDLGYFLQDIRNSYIGKDPMNPITNPETGEVLYLEKARDFLKLAILNDMEDGTSYASQALLDLRNKVIGVRDSLKESDKWFTARFKKADSAKDHFYGDTENGRFMGKTLFNASNISMDKYGKDPVKNWVIIGISSAKLKSGYKPFTESTEWVSSRIGISGEKEYYKTLYINGKPKVVLGTVDGTDTSFFKKASSDMSKEKEDTTFSGTINTKLGYDYAKAIEELQVKQIQDAFKETVGNLKNFSISSLSYSSIDTMLSQVASLSKSGLGTNSIIGWKIDDFMDKVAQIIEKPKDKGQSVFIKKSSWDIKPEEVMISKHSNLGRQLAAEIRGEISKIESSDLDTELKKQKVKEIQDTPYVVGYRYPVDSKYNLGMFKVRWAEDDANWKGSVKENQVVLNPISTYVKFKGDNDGDHLFFISARDGIGQIVGNYVADRPAKNAQSLIDFLMEKKRMAPNELPFRNKFIISDEVKKVDPSSPDFKAIPLVQWRMIALEAKESISILSSSLRTIGTLYFMFKEYGKLLSLGDKEAISAYEKQMLRTADATGKAMDTPFSEVYAKMKNIESVLDDEQLSKDFESYVSGVSSQTIDFGNSGAEVFDKSFGQKFMEKLGLPREYYAQYITPLSIGYWMFKVDKKNVESLLKMNEGWKVKDDFKSVYNGIAGSKKNLFEKMVEQFGKDIRMLNQNYELKFLVEHAPATSQNEIYKKVTDLVKHGEMDTYRISGNIYYTPKGSKEKGFNFIKDEFYKIIDGGSEELVKAKNKILYTLKSLEEITDKKRIELAKSEMYKDIMKMDLSEDDKLTLALVAYINKDYRISNLMSTDKLLEYFQKSNSDVSRKIEQLINKPDEEMTIKRVKDLQSYKEEDLLPILNEFKSQLENETDPVNKEVINGNISRIEQTISSLAEIKSSVEKKWDDIGKQVTQEMTPIPKVEQFQYPTISFERVDRSEQAVNEIFDVNVDFSTRAKNGLKLTKQSLFDKYAPKFVNIYDNIHSNLNINHDIDEANKFSVNEMSHQFFGGRDSMYSQIRKFGLKEDVTNDVLRKIQRLLLDNDNGTFKRQDMWIALENMKTLFGKPEYEWVFELLNKEEFKTRMVSYQDNVIDKVVTALNRIQKIYQVDIMEKYGKGDFSIVTDTLEGYKWDAELALKIYGVRNEIEFRNMLDKNAADLGTTIMDGTKDLMVKTVFHDQGNNIDKVLNFIQGFHYSMNYGTIATFVTQSNIVAGLSQILPNYVELKNQMMKHPDKIKESLAILVEYKMAMGDDVIKFGTGLGMDLKQSPIDKLIGGLIKKSTESLVGVTTKDRAKIVRAGELVDSIVNNMLGFNDWPLEQMRKLGAVQMAMHKAGFPNKAAFDEFMEEGGERAVRAFESQVIREFSNSGGGVVTSSKIGRGTLFENANLYFDNFVTQFAVKSLGYLMGWSLHKAANMIEKETALFTAISLLKQGDIGGFKSHFDDFIRYNAMLAWQVWSVMGIYLKFQKFEKDNQDRMDFQSFNRSFNNSVVALEILYRKHFNAWDSAEEMGATGMEKVQYTAFSIVERMFRLFKQPQFLNTMYDKYRAEDAMGEPDLVWAFKYAMDTHYSGYMDFQWMRAASGVYDYLTNKGNLAVLGNGGSTYMDEMFGNLWNNKDYAQWKDKWSIMKFISIFNWMNKTPDTPLGFKVSIDLAKELQNRVLEDPYLSRLVKGGQIGNGPNDYSVSRLVGKIGVPLDATQTANVDTLWKQVTYAGYSNVDAKGMRIKTSGEDIAESQIQDIAEKQIAKALAKQGKTMEDIIAMNPNTSSELLKTLTVLASENNLKTPLVIASMMAMEEKAITKDLRDKIGKSTGEKSDYDGSAYKALSMQQKNEIRKGLLIKYQNYFNLDNTIVNHVIDTDIRTNHKDLISKLNDISNYKGIENEMINMVKTSYVVANIMKTEKDTTNVTRLQSQYAVAMRGLNVESETGAKVAINFLNDIENNPYMDRKSKASHQAAVLYGLNKSQYELLKNNKEFDTLTEDAQKELTNWMYKVSSDTLDYDSNSYMAQLNGAATSRQATRRMSGTSGMKSKAFSDQRPNFAEQFEPVRSWLPGKQQFIAKDPEKYLQKMEDERTQPFGINNTQFPIVRQYARLMLENQYYGYKSKGIIPSYVVEPKVDMKQKKYINLKKAKKAEGQKTQGRSFKPTPKVSGGAWANLPGSNIQQ